MDAEMDIDRDAIMKVFLEESRERLGQMEEDLVGLESRPEDEELIQAIFRVAHTLKGNAAMLGFSALAEVTHVLEDLLDRVRSRTLPVTGALVTLLLESLDVLRGLLADASGGLDQMKPTQRAFLQRLQAATDTEATASTEAVAPERENGKPAPEKGGPEITPLNLVTRTLRVDLERLDRMLALVGEIAVSRGRLRQVLEQGETARLEDALDVLRDSDRLEVDLQELVMKVRMIPVGPTFHQFTRMVRDVARAQGKQVKLLIGGEDVELDMTIVERIRDPLTHMIRNAVDHGIESPSVRAAAGKDPEGSIRLRANRDGASIVIELSDDGAGLDREGLLARARAQGLVRPEEEPPVSEVDRLIFEAGLSTAEQVTEVSGRGVGLDVARRNVEELRGSLDVRSGTGLGTTFTIRLPLTLAIVDGFVVETGGERYVIPMEAILECVDLPLEEGGTGLTGLTGLRGEPLPYFRLRELFGLGGQAPEREKVVVVGMDGTKAGLVVDDLLGGRQVVLKPLGTLFREVPWVAGSAILGSGRVALVLDVPKLARMALGQVQGGPGEGRPTRE